MPSPSCLPEERIAELIAEGLTPADFIRSDSHVAGCLECQARVTARTNHALPGTGTEVEDQPSPSPPKRTVGSILPANTRVARYVILRLVGSGGMGRVYAAHDPSLDRTVALKLLRSDMATPEIQARLLREAKAMARISHPHVIAVYDADRIGDQVYIAMEFVEGGTLREWQRAKQRTWREIVAVYLRAGSGLREAHAAGIIHRDFKPDNVLVGADGNVVRVTDFGIARSALPTGGDDADPSLQFESDDAESLDSSLTRTGAVLGTPVYMAPEQTAAKGVDARTDIYAFSVALYEALYGERPFVGESFGAIQAAKLANQVRPPPDGSRVPLRLRRVVLEGLRSLPEERPASMGAMLDSLERATRSSRAPLAAVALLAAGAAWMAFGGTANRIGFTGAPAVDAATGLVATLPSCSNRTCVETHGGEPWICRANDHECVSIATEDCKAYFDPGDLEADDTVWVGALFPTAGRAAADAQAAIDAVNLGRKEFAHATRALTGDTASLRARRVAVAVCNDATNDLAERSARHLADDLRVPAILGFRSGQEVMDLAGALLIQRNVLSIAPWTTNPLITRIPQPAELPHMVWRTLFSMTDVATATATFLQKYFEPRRGPSSSPTRVVLVRTDGPGPIAFGQAFMKALVFNGKSGIENGDAYREIGVSDATAPTSAAEIQRLAERVVAGAPSFVVLQVGDYTSVPLVAAIEARWPHDAVRPLYVLAGGTPGLFAPYLGSNRDRRQRVIGIGSTDTSETNAHFVIRYNEAYQTNVTRVDNPGAPYDAFYLLAYAANALGREPASGPALARAFGRLVPPGRPIEIGPTQVFDALSELAEGGNIDLDGTSTNFDFDLSTGEAPYDFELECAAVDKNGRADGESVPAGVVLNGKTREVRGVFSCR